MIKLGELVFNPASENRCKDPLRENWCENRHGRRGYNRSADDPTKIDMTGVGPGKLS